MLIVRFIDPCGRITTEMEPYELLNNLKVNGGASITVALLANGSPDSEIYIKKVGESIKKRSPNIRTLVWNKGNDGVEASDEIVSEIMAGCRVVIAAYGY